MFSIEFLEFIILTGLAWTALAAITLLTLLIRDWRRNDLW